MKIVFLFLTLFVSQLSIFGETNNQMEKNEFVSEMSVYSQAEITDIRGLSSAPIGLTVYYDVNYSGSLAAGDKFFWILINEDTGQVEDTYRGSGQYHFTATEKCHYRLVCRIEYASGGSSMDRYIFIEAV